MVPLTSPPTVPTRRWTVRGGQGEAMASLAWPPKPPGQMAGLVGSYEVHCSAPVPISQQRELDLATRVQRALCHHVPSLDRSWGLPDGRKVDCRSFGVIHSFVFNNYRDGSVPGTGDTMWTKTNHLPGAGEGTNIRRTDTAINRWLQTEMSPRVRGLGSPWLTNELGLAGQRRGLKKKLLICP